MPCLGVDSIFYVPATYYFSTFVQPPARLEKAGYCNTLTAAGYMQKYSNSYLTLAPRTSDEISQCTLTETDITTLCQQSIANFITKGVTDQSWSDFQNQLNAMDITSYLKIYQDALDKYQGTWDGGNLGQ